MTKTDTQNYEAVCLAIVWPATKPYNEPCVQICEDSGLVFFLRWYNNPTRPQAASFVRFLDHTQLGRHNRRDSSERVIISSHRLLPAQFKTTQGTKVYALSRTRTWNPNIEAAADLRLILALPPGSASGLLGLICSVVCVWNIFYGISVFMSVLQFLSLIYRDKTQRCAGRTVPLIVTA